MSQSSPQSNGNPLPEELVAYLDGELAAGERREMEARLAEDPAARQELQRLEKVWDMLDHLPRSSVDDSFTRTTVEMVSLAAASDLRREQALLPLRQYKRWLLTGTAVLVTGILGFLTLAFAWPDANAALLRDLPVLENLELLQRAESLAFLQRLSTEGMFLGDADLPPLPGETSPPGPNGAATGPTPGVNAAISAAAPPVESFVSGLESTSQRRARLARMGSSDRAQLLRAQERFLALPVAEQDRLRKLQSDLDTHPDLRRVLVSYHDWLASLLPGQRPELLALSPEKRADEARRLKKDQEHKALRDIIGGPRTSDEDARALLAWMEQMAQQYQQQVMKSVPEADRRRIEGTPQGARRTSAVSDALWRDEARSVAIITQADVDQLMAKLSPGARTLLDKLTKPKDRIDAIRDWASKAQSLRRGRGGGPRPTGTQPTEDDLSQLLATLSPEEWARITGLPRDQMQAQLRLIYNRQHPQSIQAGPERGSPPDGRGGPGDRRGGPGDRGGSGDRGSPRGMRQGMGPPMGPGIGPGMGGGMRQGNGPGAGGGMGGSRGPGGGRFGEPGGARSGESPQARNGSPTQTPGDAKSSEAKPPESKPVETTPPETKPAEMTPAVAEPKTDDKPDSPP